MKTVGETLIDLLEAKGTDLVFGIPGVHTVELYRGLGNSSIRHITPRHEPTLLTESRSRSLSDLLLDLFVDAKRCSCQRQETA